METGSILSIIGTLIVVLLGFLLTMIKNVRSDLVLMDDRMDKHLEKVKNELLEKVSIPTCLKDMKILQREIITDVKDLIREVKP